MSDKILWLDVETTGLSAVKNDVIQVAGIVEIDGKVHCEFDFECQPHSFDNVQQRALDVSGRTKAELYNYEQPGVVKAELEGMFARFIDKFDKEDKFTLAGYNVGFDDRFMREFWSKCGDQWYGSWIDYKPYDVYPLFKTYTQAAGVDVPNHKLVTAADHFGLSFGEEGAHDALGDIRVTREVGLKMREIFALGIEEQKHVVQRAIADKEIAQGSN